MKHFLETGTYALIAGLVLIAVYVLYQRLLKAVGKGKYENFYLELNSHFLNWDSNELHLSIFVSRPEVVKIQILNDKKEEVILVHDEKLPYGEFVVKTSIEKLPVGQYLTQITSPSQVLTRYFKVK